MNEANTLYGLRFTCGNVINSNRIVMAVLSGTLKDWNIDTRKVFFDETNSMSGKTNAVQPHIRNLALYAIYINDYFCQLALYFKHLLCIHGRNQLIFNSFVYENSRGTWYETPNGLKNSDMTQGLSHRATCKHFGKRW